MNTVIVSIPEEELFISLYNDYLIRHKMPDESREDLKISVKAFSDYVLEYLKDYYNLDEEETDDTDTVN